MTTGQQIAGYRAARLAVLAQPFDPELELAAAARAEARLGAAVGLDDIAAAAEARRAVLLARERRLHETLVLDGDVDALAALVAGIDVEGALPARGVLVLALHYGAYSSLLPLALARRLGRVLFLLDRRLDPNLVLPEARVRELERGGVLPPESLGAVDVGSSGVAAVRSAHAELRAGGAVVVLADPYFLPGTTRSLPLTIGNLELHVPRGAAWLADRARVGVGATWIAPTPGGHLVSLRHVPDVATGVAALAAQVIADPAPWEGWLRDQRHL